MTPEETARLGRHDGIVVSFGAHGTQYALYVRPGTKPGVHVVRKWRVKSNSWTGEVRVMNGEIKRRALLGEFRTSLNLHGKPI